MKVQTGQTLTIKQVEQVALRMRKYGVSPDDAEAFAEVLLCAAEGPIAIQAADLVSLMRPKRPRPPRPGEIPEVRERRRLLRERLYGRWPAAPSDRGQFTIEHHVQDVASLTSAVQYRAVKEGRTWNVKRISDTVTRVTLTR